MDFREIVKRRLDESGESPITAARQAGLNRDAIRTVLRGRVPSVDRAAEICDALGIDFHIGIECPSKSGPWPDMRAKIAEIRAEFREKIEGMALEACQRLGELDQMALQASVADRPGTDDDYDGVRFYGADVSLAAGPAALPDHEPDPSTIKFRRSWLRSHGLRAENLFMINVSGDSMVPTLHDGDSVLVDQSRQSPEAGKIYALTTGDGPIVKRLGWRSDRWWAISDAEGHIPRPLGEVARILGRVVWWAHTPT